MNNQLRKKMLILRLLATLFAFPLLAQIEYAGFADILYTESSAGESGFGYGQFELDLSGTVNSYMTFEGALAYNAEDGVFEAGAGFLDIHFTGSEEEHAARGGFLEHTGLMIGQFDVPFGIDYLHIPSPDRLFVHGPLMNQKTIDGWNDVGLNIYGELSVLNFNFFAVNGAAEGIATGGRLGFPVGELMELGASYTMQTAENDAGAVPRILGLDFQSSFGSINTRIEYQKASAVEAGDFDTLTDEDEHSGFYAQLDVDLDDMLSMPLFVVARYGGWEKGEDSESRITAGLGYRFSEGFKGRAEYLSNTVNEDDPENQLTFQAVVNF